MASGRNDARRRRVILDEAVQARVVNSSELVSPAKQSSEPAKVYSQAAKRGGQLKTTDLIPKRIWPLTALIGIAVLGLVLLNLLRYGLLHWSFIPVDVAATFSLTGIGTVSNWFSSMLLVVSGMASLQIYGMRQHRCDDYNGHYRIWIFMALLFLVASINCVVDFRAIANAFTRTAGFAGENGLVILLVIKMVALTALVIRGVLEIRASRGALVAVVIVWVAYASAIVAQIPAVQSELVQNEELILGNLVLVGTVALFVSVLLYSRFVYLHANGLITIETAQAKAKVAKKKAATRKTKSPTQAAAPATESAAPTAQPKVRKVAGNKVVKKSEKVKPEPSVAAPIEAETESASEQDEKLISMPLGKKLTRANKKRLKKQQQQQHRRAA